MRNYHCWHYLTHRRYDRANFLRSISSDSSFHWCMNPTCSSGQLHEGASERPIFRCNDCGYRSCVTCSVFWHEGRTCAEFQEEKEARDESDLQSLQVVKKMSKTCPHCGARIQKNGGCDHMHCKSCRPVIRCYYGVLTLMFGLRLHA